MASSSSCLVFTHQYMWGELCGGELIVGAAVFGELCGESCVERLCMGELCVYGSCI